MFDLFFFLWCFGFVVVCFVAVGSCLVWEGGIFVVCFKGSYSHPLGKKKK